MKLVTVLIMIILSNFNLFSQNLSWEPVALDIGNKISHIIPISESKILFKSENGTFIVTDLTKIKRIDNLLPNSVEITCLAVDSKETIYAGTKNSGVFIFDETIENWNSINYDLKDLSINAIAISKDNEIAVVISYYPANKSYTSIIKNGKKNWITFETINSGTIKELMYDESGELFALAGRPLKKGLNHIKKVDWVRIQLENYDDNVVDFVPKNDIYYLVGKKQGIKYSLDSGKSWIGFYEGTNGFNNFSKLVFTENDEMILCSKTYGIFYSNNNGENFEINNEGLNSTDIDKIVVLKDNKILTKTINGNLFLSHPPKNIQISSVGWTNKINYLERKTSTEGIDFIKFSNNSKLIFTFSGSHLKIWNSETGILIKQNVFNIMNFVSASVSKDDKSILLMYLIRSPEENGNYIVSTEIYDSEDFSFIKKYDYVENIFNCKDTYGYNILKSEAEYSSEEEILFVNFTYLRTCISAAQIGTSFGKLTRVEFQNDTAIAKILYDKPISQYLFTDDKKLVILNNSYSYMYYNQNETSENYSKLMVGDYDFQNVDTLLNIKNINKQDKDYNPITKIDYLSSNGKLAGRANKKLYLWDLAKYTLTDSAMFPVKYSQEPVDFSFTNNFKKIIAGLNASINIYSFPEMQVLDSTIFKSETGYNWKIAMSPDSLSFVVGSYDGMMRLFKFDKLTNVNDNNNVLAGQPNHSFVYPNPAYNIINFENNSLSSGLVEIYTVSGIKLDEYNCTGEQIISIDISKLSQGLYFIKFQNKVFKFIKLSS